MHNHLHGFSEEGWGHCWQRTTGPQKSPLTRDARGGITLFLRLTTKSAAFLELSRSVEMLQM